MALGPTSPALPPSRLRCRVPGAGLSISGATTPASTTPSISFQAPTTYSVPPVEVYARFPAERSSHPASCGTPTSVATDEDHSPYATAPHPFHWPQPNGWGRGGRYEASMAAVDYAQWQYHAALAGGYVQVSSLLPLAASPNLSA